MRTISIVTCLFLFLHPSGFSQNQKEFSVYLIGDAGEDTVSGKALLMLKDELLKNPNSAVVFMGDNVYPSGLKENDIKSARHLESQLKILNEYKGEAFFIPGNHDWDAQQAKGLKRIKNQELYVTEYLKTKSTVANKDKTTFLPAGGLPGPTSVLLDNGLRLITIDSQWFLHRYAKNTNGTLRNTKKVFFEQLEKMLNEAEKNKEQVIITAHHPMYTNGEHSKGKQPWRFLLNYTPFFIFGLKGGYDYLSQDLAQPKYKHFRKPMLALINKHNNVLYASGHEHNLQFFTADGHKYIVSGCGSKLTPLQNKKKFDSVFQDDTKTGFVKLVYEPAGNHKTIIYRVGEEPKLLEGF